MFCHLTVKLWLRIFACSGFEGLFAPRHITVKGSCTNETAEQVQSDSEVTENLTLNLKAIVSSLQDMVLTEIRRKKNVRFFNRKNVCT